MVRRTAIGLLMAAHALVGQARLGHALVGQAWAAQAGTGQARVEQAGVEQAGAAGTCPAIPPRNPMPAEAVATPNPLPMWQTQVEAIAKRLPQMGRETKRMVFLGDSITASWDPVVFSQAFGTRAPLLLGVGGDTTQGLLARLPGEWGPLRPRLAVLLIGTNNTKWGTGAPADVALGIAEVVRAIHARSSGTRVLVLGVLPTGADPGDPLRAVNAKVNALVARCADGDTTFYLDAGPALLDRTGHLAANVSFDMLHLTPYGYTLLAAALEPDVRRIMGE